MQKLIVRLEHWGQLKAVALSCLILAVSVGTARAADASSTRPSPPPQGGAFEPLIRQGVANGLAIPEIEDGKPKGMSIRSKELLRFVLKDFRQRAGENSDGPRWERLSYSIVGYQNSDHIAMAFGGGSLVAGGGRTASYSMSLLSDPDEMQHALVQAVLLDKEGGHFCAYWDLRWAADGWQVNSSSVPTAASVPGSPAAIK